MKSQSNHHWYISNSPLGPDLRLFDQCLTDLVIISQLHNSPLISPPLPLPYFLVSLSPTSTVSIFCANVRTDRAPWLSSISYRDLGLALSADERVTELLR